MNLSDRRSVPSCLIVLLGSLGLIIVGCGPSASPGPSMTATPTLPEAMRLGRHDLHEPGTTLANGVVASVDDGDGGVTVTVSIQDPVGIHPWGIYDQDGCGRPAIDHEAPWQFADIEGGRHVERVERDAYLGFAGDLSVLVFGTNGAAVTSCAELGGPLIAATPSATPETCPADGPRPSKPIPAPGAIAVSADNLSNADIYLLAADGSARVRLTTSLGIDSKPSWSPDGTRIAFRTNRDGQDEIYVMAADGSCQRDITNSPVDDRSPAWSPDGSRIAFDHFFGAGLQDIATIRPDGTGLVRLTTRSGEYPSWSPDGSRLAFASVRDGDYDIYVMNADGTQERALTVNATYDMYPAWSADGAWIAYECETQPTSGFLGEAPDICLVKPDGTARRQLMSDVVSDRFPAWSPSGMLSWSREGTIEVSATPGDVPTEIGSGVFPAWRP
jgi:hypothetical protein